MFPGVEAFALASIRSDHSPILLALTTEKVERKKLFRFESFWLESVECRRIVKEIWDELEGEGADLVAKSKAVAAALEKWSKKTYPNSQRQIHKLKSEL